MKYFILSVIFLLSACGGESAESKYDSGYSDGYASGYNTTCEIRSTMIEGDWSDENYKAGYDAGYAAGSVDCLNSSDNPN